MKGMQSLLDILVHAKYVVENCIINMFVWLWSTWHTDCGGRIRGFSSEKLKHLTRVQSSNNVKSPASCPTSGGRAGLRKPNSTFESVDLVRWTRNPQKWMLFILLNHKTTRSHFAGKLTQRLRAPKGQKKSTCHALVKRHPTPNDQEMLLTQATKTCAQKFLVHMAADQGVSSDPPLPSHPGDKVMPFRQGSHTWFLWNHTIFETFGPEWSCVVEQETFLWRDNPFYHVSTTMQVHATGFVIAEL